MNRYALGAALIGLAGTGATALAQYTITDGNSSAHFDTTSLAPGSRVGMDNWTVDGVNHMYSQWFWYRTNGMNSEQRINALPLDVGGTTDTNFNGVHDTLFLRYGGANTGYTIEVSFRIHGGSAGSGTADIAEQILITNNSTFTRTFSFFQYCDFDLNSDVADDMVGLVNANAVTQADFLSGTTVSETVFTPTYSHYDLNVYPTTVNDLDDGGITNFTDPIGPLLGRRDYTWGFQWDITLAPGESFLISKDKQIVPSPGAAALAGIGALALSRRRRR